MYNENIKNKYYEKKTLVTINSNDRTKNTQLITELNSNKITNDGFKIIDYETILVSHVNHNYDLSNTNEVIFKNITGVYNANLNKYTIGGIPVDYLNYNENLGKPIFNIDLVYETVNNRVVSNSYKIKIPININNAFIILNSSGGGSNVIVEKIVKFIKGYEDSSHYKIGLPRSFKNIVNVKLVNLEMSNAQYSIRDVVSKKYNSKEDYISENNFIHWINKENETLISDNFLINNEKMMSLINNNINNIPTKWQKNKTTENTLYEHLSDTYLHKINNNLDNYQNNFVNLLYLLKYKIESSTTLTTAMKNVINHNDSYFIKFTNDGIVYKIVLRDRTSETNTATEVSYFINDFYVTRTLIEFIEKFTSYNSIINSYNKDLTLHFHETYTYSDPIPTTGPVNIYNYIQNITEYKINKDETRLYFTFLNNSDIKLEYYYIKYLFIYQIDILIKEIVQFNYNNIKKNKQLEIYQYDFLTYLNQLAIDIIKPLNSVQNNVIKYGYLLKFTKNSINYHLYLNNAPDNTSNTVNYKISHLKDISEFINFMKNFTSVNTNYTLDTLNNTSIFNSNIYELPNTIYSISGIDNNVIDVYRNIEYKFNYSAYVGSSTKVIKISSSQSTPILDYDYNNNVKNENNIISITVSIYENINKLYIIDVTNNANTTLRVLNIKGIDDHNTNFSIYGYLHNIALNQKLEYVYNNILVPYTYIKDSFITYTKSIINEINSLNDVSYNLLVKTNEYSTIDLDNQYYWNLPSELNTNIYTSSIETNVKRDVMVENKHNYTDIMNIKYIPRSNINLYNLYPIYSVQIHKGNYLIDEFVGELEQQLNSVSKKKYDYKSKLFMEETKYNIKTSLKKDSDKPIFTIELNENNNLLYMYQYEKIYSYSSADLTSVNQSGPFIVNEGYPFVFIKHTNHSLKTGDIINITGASNIFNITTDEINKRHQIYTNKIYRCHIRFLLPLDDNVNTIGIGTQYFFEGNKFIDFSSYKSGINKIYSIDNVTKDNIGNNTKNINMDFDISIYELIIGNGDLTLENINENKTVVGRVLSIIKNTDTNNFILDYSLLSENNFRVGDVFKTSNTNTYAMVVPETWDKHYLPKYHNIINDNIEEINNIATGYSIKLNTIPNKTSLVGIGGININILKPTEYSLLFNKENTLNEILGFQKKMTDFDLVQTNTFKVNENVIEYTYLENSFNDNIQNQDKYIMIKTIIPHNYNVGSLVYINSHTINYNLIDTYFKTKLNIKQYEPFIVWYNNLSLQHQKNVKNSLSDSVFKKYCSSGIIIYYSYPYTNKQVQDLGNNGMPVKQYNELNYFNYKETPIPNIYNLKENSYIYINQNQKTVEKNILNVKTTYKIGLRDGYYKVLNNIPIYSSSYYNNYFNNTNCAIIECNYLKITERSSLNSINYNETINTNTTTYKESVLEGFLNNGEILSPTLNTNIVGSQNSNYEKYTGILLNKKSNTDIDVYFPINYTFEFYINYINNIYYVNNNTKNIIDIYENINYKFDISDTSLLNKLFIISTNKTNVNPYNSLNTNNTVLQDGLPGKTGSTININMAPYSNITKLYVVVENIIVLELNIKEVNTITYNVLLLKEDTYEFTNTLDNSILINPTFNIEIGKKYKFKFNSITDYNNFVLIHDQSFNNKISKDYITYNAIEMYIIIQLINNNYDKDIYYHLNNVKTTIGKITLGIYNYYNTDRLILLNSSYIDNINTKFLNKQNINNNIDSNIIKYINYISTNKYYFSISFKNNLNIVDVNSYIIPQNNMQFLYENCKKNQNKIKIQAFYENVLIKQIENNEIIINTANYNLYVDNIITLQNNIPNTQIVKDDIYYIKEIDNTFTRIKLGNIKDKSLVNINDISKFTSDIYFSMKVSYNYRNKYELINKSIKINYLESYENLTNAAYNTEISKISNNIENINTSNSVYYNYISNNVTIIENKEFKNLNWKTPYGSIYIDLSENNIINYIKFKNIDTSNNNHPYKIYLYYIENNIINLIGSITDVLNNNILLNTMNKNKFILYVETYGLHKMENDVNKPIYSELNITELEIGYINPIQNDITYIQNFVSKLSINNIINKYSVSDNYLDKTTITDTTTLLLNNSKSSIIDIMFTSEIALQYYNIIQIVNNSTITINNKKYKINYDNGTINTIQLFGSNNMDYSNEVEITEARYSNSTIVSVTDTTGSGNSLVINTRKIINQELEKTFTNTLKFKYYRFKIISNINYYPYLKPITDSNEQILTPLQETILLSQKNDDYSYNFNTNTVNINKHIFNINISGIIVGIVKQENYSNLYIEDINYITDVDMNYKEYMILTLKYNLLNSHKKGENVIISGNQVNENLFTTQNLIIYKKWYTRIFYRGYTSLYNYNHVSRTLYETTIDFALLNKSTTLQIYSNSKYSFRHNKKLKIYKLVINATDSNKFTSITEIPYNNYNITQSFTIYENVIYNIFTMNKLKYVDLDNNIIGYKFILSVDNSLNGSSTLVNSDYVNINMNYNNNKEGLPILQDYLTNNIHIENMNGFYIPENCYNTYDTNITKTSTSNIITPVSTNNYNTYTYTYLDLVFKSDNKTVDNTENELYKNGIPIFGHYNNDLWVDTIKNDNCYVNYYSVTLEGKYLGFNGVINSKVNNTDSIINKNVDGFKILDIGYDSNNIKNIIKLDIKLSDLGILSPNIYLGDLSLLQDKTKQNKYVIGYGGNLYQKNIYRDFKGITGAKHLYLSINKLDTILTTNKTSYFSKIILSANPGTHLYDTFVENDTMFETQPIDELSELEIRFINDEGKLFNLEQTEHTFVLEITEALHNFDNSNYFLN